MLTDISAEEEYALGVSVIQVAMHIREDESYKKRFIQSFGLKALKTIERLDTRFEESGTVGRCYIIPDRDTL